MTLNSDAKFKVKLTCSFKYDLRNFVNFHPITQKSKNFTSMGYFYPKYIRFELKKYRGVISLMTLNGDAKSEETLTLRFQIWHEELGKLYYNTQTLKTVH